MQLTEKGNRIVHQASTQDILLCLSNFPSYSTKLITVKPNMVYNNFLQWLIQNNFYNDQDEKMTLKMMAANFKIDPSKITKWIHQIYNDIFTLNQEQSQLFQTAGVNVTLLMKHYDARAAFYTSMPVIPREHETVSFQFVEAKMGTNSFWVEEINHEFTNGQIEITVSLQGGIANKYREFILDKALFHEYISLIEVHQKQGFEIDYKLRDRYR